jgi:hypothetical protein
VVWAEPFGSDTDCVIFAVINPRIHAEMPSYSFCNKKRKEPSS